MAIKTPLRELQQAVVCVIAADTYRGYQKDISRVTVSLSANLEVLHVTDLRMRAL